MNYSTTGKYKTKTFWFYKNAVSFVEDLFDDEIWDVQIFKKPFKIRWTVQWK